ncbi:MAG: DUF72 domain-containing protein, partial [Candidatus Latescibacteria bacterium]|nr:DUF72 domain-containing protein [Candidatus Latescibacterota bacterium]
LYPENARSEEFLTQYASVFNSVEGNSTFYAVPSEDTLAGWRARTPDGFRFCFKFPRAISHHKRLVDARQETEQFLGRLESIRDRLGPLFLQLPPAFGPDSLPRLDEYLSALPEAFCYAVEVRHPAFFYTAAGNDLIGLLRNRDASRVILDGRSVAEPDEWEGAAPIRLEEMEMGSEPFVRYIGRTDPEESNPFLEEWAVAIARWVSEGRTPYVFLHTGDDLYAPHLARQFHEHVSTRSAVGEMPDWPGESAGSQLRFL